MNFPKLRKFARVRLRGILRDISRHLQTFMQVLRRLSAQSVMGATQPPSGGIFRPPMTDSKASRSSMPLSIAPRLTINLG